VDEVLQRLEHAMLSSGTDAAVELFGERLQVDIKRAGDVAVLRRPKGDLEVTVVGDITGGLTRPAFQW
jgi:hypothetical protein